MATLLPSLIQEEQLDFVVANGENAAGGKGITPDTFAELIEAGVDVVTTGNHTRDKTEIDPILETDSRILRPLNFSSPQPGRGSVICQGRQGTPVGVINSMGVVHMRGVDLPYEATKAAVADLAKETPFVVVDFHAEATSEKRAMGWYLDGLASAVMGTHTHVQTADEEVLPQGTAFISDLGMTGPHHSVIGLRTDLAFARLMENRKDSFIVAKGDVRLCGAVVELDERTGKARSIRRIRKDLPPN